MKRKEINTEEVKQDIDSIFKTFDKLKKESIQSKRELSELDRELSNHYHNIEGYELEYMSDSHILLIKLRDILFRRRQAKINHTLLESFVTTLNGQIEKTKKRSAEIIEKHAEIVQEIKDRAK